MNCSNKWGRPRRGRLRDHPGRVQGWESACGRVLGIPLLANKKLKHVFLMFSYIFHFCLLRFILCCMLYVCFLISSFSIYAAYFSCCIFTHIGTCGVRNFQNVRYLDLQKVCSENVSICFLCVLKYVGNK